MFIAKVLYVGTSLVQDGKYLVKKVRCKESHEGKFVGEQIRTLKLETVAILTLSVISALSYIASKQCTVYCKGFASR